MSGEGAGYWILASTIITVLAPIFARYMENVLLKFLDKLSLGCAIRRKWKSSVQIVSNTTITNFCSRSRMDSAYKAVMFQLISKHGGVPLSHIRQQSPSAGWGVVDNDAAKTEQEDFLNRTFNFIATGYNKAVLLDEETKTYVIPTHEENSYKDTITTNDVINIVSNHASTTQILNLVSGYQVKYQDYIKRYNKEGKLKYMKMRIAKDFPSVETKGNLETNGRTPVHNPDNCKRSPIWDISDFTSSKTFANVFFNDKERIIQQLDHFTTGEEFYRHRGIPWTLNILLYGVPGCGKTSFIKALSNKFKRHIVDVSLTSIKTTEDFHGVFNTEMFKDLFIPIDKRIIVLEDIDCMGSDILADRSKKKDHGEFQGQSQSQGQSQIQYQDLDDKMNLSCFLNTLDGIQEQNGRIIIATTNCIDSLDPAVLRRFNVKVHFTHLTRPLAQSIINNYYDYEVPLPDGWVPHNLTGASLTQLCMQYQDEPDMLVGYLAS